MSRTTIALKFKMAGFQTKYATKLKSITDINLASLMPDEDKNFGVFLVLDFRTR